jgi:histidinol-phosphate aminotransferase
LLNCLGECKNLAVARTFSKAYGLAGLRVGYMAAGDPLVARALGKVLLPYNVNALSLLLARTVYAQKSLYGQTARAIAQERERVYGRLSSLGLKVCPSAANFLFFAVPGEGRTAALAENLAARRIFVRDFSQNPLLAGLRMTVGTYGENEKALAAIQEFLR